MHERSRTMTVLAILTIILGVATLVCAITALVQGGRWVVAVGFLGPLCGALAVFATRRASANHSPP